MATEWPVNSREVFVMKEGRSAFAERPSLFLTEVNYFLALGVAMLGDFENLAGSFLNVSGQPAQQKK